MCRRVVGHGCELATPTSAASPNPGSHGLSGVPLKVTLSTRLVLDLLKLAINYLLQYWSSSSFDPSPSQTYARNAGSSP